MSSTVNVVDADQQLTFGADVDDLKAAWEQLIQAWNSRDIEKLRTCFHESWVVFGWSNPFPEVRMNNDAHWQGVKDMFANMEVFSLTLIDPQYRVVGDTGIVWGYHRAVTKLKDGPQETTYRRVITTWVKSGDKWLLAANHRSAIPSGN